MNCNRNPNRYRQYTPPGWERAQKFVSCNGRDRSVKFQAQYQGECGPSCQPIIISAKMNLDDTTNPNADPCLPRKFCASPWNQSPVNINLKICPASNNKVSYQNPNSCKSRNLVQTNSSSDMAGNGGLSSLKKDPLCQQCPNTCPLPRCPPGVKVTRTLPIIPERRTHETYFKMPNASVYKTDYIQMDMIKAQSYAPERIVAETNGEFQQESLTKVDYKPHPVCPYKRPPWSFPKPREESCLKLDGISCYKTDYIPKDGKPATSAKPVRLPDPDAGAMDDRSLYQIEFVPHCLPTHEKYPKEDPRDNLIHPCVPFDGLTIYKRDYIPKRGLPAVSVHVKERAYMKELAPIDTTTTYKASFEPYYFDDYDCIPADIYDAMIRPKDKCSDYRCNPLAKKPMEFPDEFISSSPTYNSRCTPKPSPPCVPAYFLQKETSPYDNDTTTIRLVPNYSRVG